MYTVPTVMMPDNTILVSYRDEELDHGDMIHPETIDVLFSHEKLNEPTFAMTF